MYMSLENQDLFGKNVELTVSEREISKIVGQNRCNLERLRRETQTIVKKIKSVPDEAILRARIWSRN